MIKAEFETAVDNTGRKMYRLMDQQPSKVRGSAFSITLCFLQRISSTFDPALLDISCNSSMSLDVLSLKASASLHL